jgi:hypothetical protein
MNAERDSSAFNPVGGRVAAIIESESSADVAETKFTDSVSNL